MTSPATPAVLLLLFNRPETTRQVFASIRAARPARLYLAADGPRAQVAGERARCEEARRVIAGVDWPCEVKTLLREENLGCKRGVSGGIEWFFQNESEGIVLEDDCVPDASFFRFCAVLLGKYRDDPRIMHISGDNFQQGQVRGDGSYYFSHYPHVWGWASWRRAWSTYDVSMKAFPDFMNRDGLRGIFRRRLERAYWYERLSLAFSGNIDTWDYQWNFSLWKAGGVAILPNGNLVSNIGFGSGATHTTSGSSVHSHSTTVAPEGVQHPSAVTVDGSADRYTFDTHYVPGHRRRLRYRIRGFLR